jgi:hypothetical protein
MESGLEIPIPTLPLVSTLNIGEVVAKETNGEVEVPEAMTERSEPGVVDPIPTFPALVIVNNLAFDDEETPKISAVGFELVP